MVQDESHHSGEASSTMTAGFDFPPHMGTSSQYIDSLKRACLPRLAREQGSQSSCTSPRTLSDRLNQMRVEDRRRERNRQQLEQQQQQHTTVRSAPTALPVYDVSSSASARAGTLYYQSSHLAQQEKVEKQQVGELRRKYAGPTPPSSWVTESKDVAHKIGTSHSPLDLDLLTRRRSTHALRYFIDGGAKEDHLASLSDLCLSRIARCICDGDGHATAELRMETAAFLPVHLKERMMALGGREQLCEPLDATALYALLDGGSLNREMKQGQTDSWDANESGKTPDILSLTVLDLSYARIRVASLKNILAQGLQMHQLRSLSLAGWGQDDQYKQKSLVTVPHLIEAIGSLPHLELLSLAKTRLYPVSKEDQSKSKESRMLESITFLKRLSRSSLRLHVLDLSECDWILGPDVANLGWYSVDKVATRSKIIWPRLQHLVLTNCPVFLQLERPLNQVQPSPAYVAKWHAAHHGVAVVTNSPYLLEHRPGLGNAVFQAEDAQHARQVRQRRIARQNQRENGWGSSEDSEDEKKTAYSLRSSSSSAYPTRCPVSGVHVGAWEWERARVLDAVRGRWGSAIKGDIVPDTAHMGGSFIEIYF